MPTPIKKSEIKFEDGLTIIEGNGGRALRNGLVQKQVLMFSELVQNGVVVRPTDISIDDHGRVIINNNKWTKILQERINGSASLSDADPSFFDTNCQCS